jgi:hypothetical protein
VLDDNRPRCEFRVATHAGTDGDDALNGGSGNDR